MKGKDRVSRDNTWKLLASSAVLAAGMGANLAMQKSWEKFTREEPPRDPVKQSSGWDEALLWTLGTSLVVGLFKLGARSGASALGRTKLGHKARGRSRF